MTSIVTELKPEDIPVVVGTHTYSYDEERVPYFGMKVLQVKDGAFTVAPE